MKKLNKKGFTLAELLIVVAIIAVLVAISIPIFSAQLHKARRATDEANARSLYANLQADYLSESGGTTTYSGASWDSTNLADGKTITSGGTFKLSDGEVVKLQDSDVTITLHLDADNGWGMEFQCAEFDDASIKWGVQ